MTDSNLAGSSFSEHPADDTPSMPGLHGALDRLRRFRETFNDGEPVDEESGLTADDLTVILGAHR